MINVHTTRFSGCAEEEVSGDLMAARERPPATATLRAMSLARVRRTSRRSQASKARLTLIVSACHGQV